MNDKITVCTDHQDERMTPMLWTFAFPQCEWWWLAWVWKTEKQERCVA